MTAKSQFDSGHWSEVNGLPAQDDIINYLEHLFMSDPNKNHTRRGLMESVIHEFGIPAMAAEAEGPKSNTTGFYSRCTYLITDAIQGKRRAANPFAKRLTWGVYQHISGDGKIDPTVIKAPAKPVSKHQVKLARVSVKILKGLGKSPEEIMVDLGGIVWDDLVVEVAIKQEFNLI